MLGGAGGGGMGGIFQQVLEERMDYAKVVRFSPPMPQPKYYESVPGI